ncbi:MAG: hypothetical protein WCS99_08080 [Limisphaerales bacterium]
MKLIMLCLLCATGVLLSGEPLLEKLVLFNGDTAKTWSAAEATMLPSTDRVKTAGPSLHWHITVDYYAGEAKYPIGWPRVSHTVTGATGDWSAWDFLHMWIYTGTSREALPTAPVSLIISQGGDKSLNYSRTLSELKKGEWVEVRIPISKFSQPNDVRVMQFSIAEDKYHHQDKLDFYIDDLALLRYAAPTVLDFTAVNAVMFDDVRQIPVSFRLTGISQFEHKRVTWELRRQGRVMAGGTVESGRGGQRVALDVSKASLQAGDYELRASVEGGTATATALVRVVASPWRL